MCAYECVHVCNIVCCGMLCLHTCLMSSHHSNGISSRVQTHTTTALDTALDTAGTYTYSCVLAGTNHCISSRCLPCILHHNEAMYASLVHTTWTCHKAGGIRYSNYLINSVFINGGFISLHMHKRLSRLDGATEHEHISSAGIMNTEKNWLHAYVQRFGH